MGGMMAITGPDAQTPTKVGPGVGDIIPGLMLGFGVLAAIHHARRTGVGQFVDVSMVDAILAVCERTVWQHCVQGLTPRPEGNHHPFLCPFGLFAASDGHVTIAAHQDGFFGVLCEAIGASELVADARFANVTARTENRRRLVEELDGRLSRFTKRELTDRLAGRIPFGPVMNIAEIMADPHFAARDMIVDVDQPGASTVKVAGVPIKMTATPGGVRRRGPLLGEDTRARLSEIGLSDEEIRDLIDRRVAIAADAVEAK
jgi:crotonobetainyl-CoA:carnitine CoA-transferase CaiB-like acyl-CoA transferase